MTITKEVSGLQLILGGARSGKSRLAEQRAIDSGKSKIYVATATAGDVEMSSRIKLHQEQRKHNGWQLVEEPLHLGETLLRYSRKDVVIVVDCLTLWLSNCLANDSWLQQREALYKSIPHLQGEIILVSNEVGLGVVPLGELSRNFVDESGFLHQSLANYCQQVIFVAAGLPLKLKG